MALKILICLLLRFTAYVSVLFVLHCDWLAESFIVHISLPYVSLDMAFNGLILLICSIKKKNEITVDRENILFHQPNLLNQSIASFLTILCKSINRWHANPRDRGEERGMELRYIHREQAIRKSERCGWIIGQLARGARSHSTSNYVITSELTRGWGKGNLLGQPTCN